MIDDLKLEAYTNRRIADLYDLILPQVWPDGDVAFYVDQATRLGGPILELGCGSGRVLLPLARAGVAVTGLDLSSAFLEIVREKLTHEPAAVRDRVALVEGRMEDFDLQQRFVAVVIACNSFGHLLDRDRQQDCLDAAARHLQPGGALYLHVAASFDAISCPTRTPFAFSLAHGAWVGCDDRLVRADPGSGIVELQWVYEFIRADRPYEKVVLPMALKFTPLAELTKMLEAAGLHLRQSLTEWDGRRFADGTILFVAEKPA